MGSLALVSSVACRSAPAARATGEAPAPELVIAPMPVDEHVDAGGPRGVAAEADAGEAARWAGAGWMVHPERGISPSYTERAVVLEAIKKAPHRALLAHEDHVEDCSSVGGSHAFFTMISPRKGTAYWGGRGTHLSNASEKGGLWVASIEPLARPRSVKNAAFCIPDRTIDAGVTALVPVGSREEGMRLLEELGH